MSFIIISAHFRSILDTRQSSQQDVDWNRKLFNSLKEFSNVGETLSLIVGSKSFHAVAAQQGGRNNRLSIKNDNDGKLK